jgi:hypothetical protein
VGADPGDRGGEPGDGVVRVHQRAVAGGAAGDQAQPEDALLRGLEQVEPAVVDGHAEAADLAHRVAHPVEGLAVVLHQVAGAVQAAGLLVGGEGEHDVARGSLAAGGHLLDDGQDHGVGALHVDRAPAPQVPVADLRGERVDRPVGADGGHDVEVPVQEQARTAGVGPGPAGDDAGPPGPALGDRGVEPASREDRGHVLGGRPLPRSAAVPRVGRVEPQQVDAQVDDPVLGRDDRPAGGLAGVGRHGSTVVTVGRC